VLDHGRVIARGTSDELKWQIGGQVLELRPVDPAHLGAAADALASLSGGSPAVDPDSGMVGVSVDDASLVAAAVRRLDDAGVPIADLALRGPSLDDVFLSLTGRRAKTDLTDEPPTQGSNEQRSAA
jgi:oleandomycin transport system ATP-binding protein